MRLTQFGDDARSHMLFMGRGYVKITRWGDIKDHQHPYLKISPTAVVPHTSHAFHAILNLSFKLQVNNKMFPSINDTTTLLAEHNSKGQVGNVLPCLVHTVTSINPSNGPIYFEKWDIKDGFWCLMVSEEDMWPFGYILPCINGGD